MILHTASEKRIVMMRVINHIDAHEHDTDHRHRPCSACSPSLRRMAASPARLSASGARSPPCRCRCNGWSRCLGQALLLRSKGRPGAFDQPRALPAGTFARSAGDQRPDLGRISHPGGAGHRAVGHAGRLRPALLARGAASFRPVPPGGGCGGDVRAVLPGGAASAGRRIGFSALLRRPRAERAGIGVVVGGAVALDHLRQARPASGWTRCPSHWRWKTMAAPGAGLCSAHWRRTSGATVSPTHPPR